MSVYITREMVRQAADTHKREGADSVFSLVLRFLARRWQRRKAIAELEAMDDYLLRDVGIHRGDIRRVVSQPYDRHPHAVRSAAATKSEEQRPRDAKTTGPSIVSA